MNFLKFRHIFLGQKFSLIFPRKVWGDLVTTFKKYKIGLLLFLWDKMGNTFSYNSCPSFHHIQYPKNLEMGVGKDGVTRPLPPPKVCPAKQLICPLYQIQDGGTAHAREFTASMKVYIPRFRRTLFAKETASNKKTAQNKLAYNLVLQLYKCGAITSLEVRDKSRDDILNISHI